MKKTLLAIAVLLTASCGLEKITDAPKPGDRVQEGADLVLLTPLEGDSLRQAAGPE